MNACTRLTLPQRHYHMAGAFDAAEKCVGLSYFWIATKLTSGKHREADSLVVGESHRGAGRLLSGWMPQLARQGQRDTVVQDAYASNSAAHRFYFREGFHIKRYHFYKSINT
ncbi:N-acetyltransferase [Pontibacter actiniarum]|uniref:N-acetyltransferase n=1 Tax=Pontibacter actiniarum TaxID=323450 RepID=A0A1X9YW27_9BACT|nr:N-acetyltransferase [Pontibacter actiniarum]ARS36964.1 N-acetyltransferase [Pontibacter actiniarum]